MAYSTKEKKAAYDRVRNVERRTKLFRQGQLAQNTTIGDPLPSPAIVLPVKAPKHGLKIAVIPDCQVKPGVPIEHLAHAGKYIAAKRPDVVVCIGDFADLPSLSTWDKPGSLNTEGRRYKADLDAVYHAMDALMTPIAKAKGYQPLLIETDGNHEDRITRAVGADPRLVGTISTADLRYEEYGWRVIPYLQPVIIGGVAFSHFFPAGVMGRPISSPDAILAKLHMSAFAGHMQGRQVAYARRADGHEMTAIISGSFYQHAENYLSPLANQHWRGMWMLHEVKDGSFDEMALSLNYLKRRFG